MGLMDTLRNAEHQQERNLRRGAEKLREGMKNVDAAIRRKVRPMIGSSHPDPVEERDSSPARKVRTGIVSVNGRDVGELRCTGGRKGNA